MPSKEHPKGKENHLKYQRNHLVYKSVQVNYKYRCWLPYKRNNFVIIMVNIFQAEIRSSLTKRNGKWVISKQEYPVYHS